MTAEHVDVLLATNKQMTHDPPTPLYTSTTPLYTTTTGTTPLLA